MHCAKGQGRTCLLLSAPRTPPPPLHNRMAHLYTHVLPQPPPPPPP